MGIFPLSFFRRSARLATFDRRRGFIYLQAQGDPRDSPAFDVTCSSSFIPGFGGQRSTFPLAAMSLVPAPGALEVEAAPTNGVGRASTDGCSVSGSESTAVGGKKTRRGKNCRGGGKQSSPVVAVSNDQACFPDDDRDRRLEYLEKMVADSAVKQATLQERMDYIEQMQLETHFEPSDEESQESQLSVDEEGLGSFADDGNSNSGGSAFATQLVALNDRVGYLHELIGEIPEK